MDTAPPDYAGIRYPTDQQVARAFEIIRQQPKNEPIFIGELLEAMGTEVTDEVSWLLWLIIDLTTDERVEADFAVGNIVFRWWGER